MTSQRIGNGQEGSAGRWCLNTGAGMLLFIPSLCSDGPVRVYVDLASVRAVVGRMVALADHDSTRVIGYWDNIVTDATGICADLFLASPANDQQAEVIPDAIRIRTLVDSGVPLQVSIGANDAGGQYVAIDSEDEIPTFRLVGANLFEASVLTFGADDATGRIAAHKLTAIESPKMAPSILASLFAKLPEKHHMRAAKLFAEGKSESDIAASIQAAEVSEKDEMIASLQAQVAALSAEIAAAKAAKCEDAHKDEESDEEKKKKKTVEDVEAAASSTDSTVRFVPPVAAPASRLDAINAVVASGKAKGTAAIAEAARQYPTLFA